MFYHIRAMRFTLRKVVSFWSWQVPVVQYCSRRGAWVSVLTILFLAFPAHAASLTRDYYSGGYSCATCTSNFGGDDSTIKDTCSVASPCPAYAADAGSVNFVPTLCEDQLLCVGSSGTVIAEVDQTCFCDANGCSIGTPAQNITLDGALSEDQQTFTGTLALPKGSGTTTTNYTIVLKRQ